MMILTKIHFISKQPTGIDKVDIKKVLSNKD